MIPNTKVFCGGLPAGLKPEELRNLFENYGVVTECDIMNRCGFVHMQNPDMASSAIEALNNTNFKGATISVEPGRMKERGGGGGGGGGNSRRSQPGNRGGDKGFRGNNQRGGGMGNRGGNGMRSQRDGGFGGGRSFGDRNNSGMGGGGGGGGFGNGSGPMRRDNRGGNQRNTPYIRGGSGGSDSTGFGGRNGAGSFGGRSGFGNDRFDNRSSMDNRGGSINDTFGGGGRFNNNSMSGNGGGGGGYGMGSQDRRGFALPDRQSFANSNGNGGGSMFNDRMGGGGGGGRMGNDQGYDRRSHMGNGNQFGGSNQYGGGNFGGSSTGNDMFNRRGGGGPGNGDFNRNSTSGGSNFARNMAGNAGFSQDFPPLNTSGMNRSTKGDRNNIGHFSQQNTTRGQNNRNSFKDQGFNKPQFDNGLRRPFETHIPDAFAGNASYKPRPPFKMPPDALRMGLRPPVLGIRPPFIRPHHSFMGANSPNLPPFARFRAPPFPGPFPQARFVGPPRPQFYPMINNRNNNQTKMPNQKSNNNAQIDVQSTKKSDRLDDARKQNPWMTDDLIELMKKKNKANQKWLKNKDDVELKKLARQATNIYTRERNKIKKKYQETQSELAENGDELDDDCDNNKTTITTTDNNNDVLPASADTSSLVTNNNVIVASADEDEPNFATNENSVSSCNDNDDNDNDIIQNNGDKNEIMTDSARYEDTENSSHTNGIVTNVTAILNVVEHNKSDNLNNNDTSIEQIALSKLDKLSMKSTVDEGVTFSDDNCVISET